MLVEFVCTSILSLPPNTSGDIVRVLGKITVYPEIFAVKKFSQLSVTSKISRTNFFLQQNTVSLPDPRGSLSSSMPS